VTTYSLPDLPYDYGALAPHIAGEIMELHHSKHHQTYVGALNQTLDKLADARDRGDFSAIVGLEKTLAFNLGGHVNHSIFWTNLSPDGGDKPTDELGAAIDDGFGSFDKFQAHFTATALGVQGSGWAVLAWDSIGQRLIIVQFFDQQGNLPAGIVPLLMLDVWEHAYYLDYKNVRADYVKAFWNIANWGNAQDRLGAAREKTSGLLLLS
jgi:superoxide dismutase, Fe-Mn family